MAKTIKFNLVCDGYQIRTLEDLRNHFSIEDILQYYRDKVLEKWLTVRGYTEELDAVKSFESDSPLEIIERLVLIFKVETDKDLIEYATSTIRYKEEREKQERLQKENDSKVNVLYSQYLERYEKLKDDIKENPRNKPIIQAAIDQIVIHYAEIFNMDYRNFFYEIRDVSPLAIICILMNPFTRKYYILDETPNNDEETPSSVKERSDDIEIMYKWIASAVYKNEFLEGLGNYLIRKDNETGTRFVHITDKKCIVIKLEQYKNGAECAISRFSDNEHFLKPKEVNGKFLILDGLQFQNMNKYNNLFYIEI